MDVRGKDSGLKTVIIGAGGLACQVLDIAEACNRSGGRHEILGHIVESPWGEAGPLPNGLTVLGDFDWLDAHGKGVAGIVAVAAPETRFRLVQKAEEMGIDFCNIIHPAAILPRRISLGVGAVLHAGTVLSFQTRIGNHVVMNMNCAVGENAVIEDFATLSPGANICGDVTIGRGAFIGTGANIIEKVRIGEWSIIGAGATVIDDVPPNTTVVGVPGRVIKTREAGWHEHNTLLSETKNNFPGISDTHDRRISSNARNYTLALKHWKSERNT